MLAAVAVVSAASLAALAAVSTASLAALAVTAVGSVDVAVLDFLPGSFADLDDLDVEMEVFAGERVVGIDLDLVAFNADDRDDLRPILTVGFELHANGNLAPVEFVLADSEQEFLVPLAVAVRRSDYDLDRVSGLLALEVFLETRDNIAPAVEVDKRFSGVGGIDELSIVIDELVVEGYDTILLNDHCCSFRDRARVLVSV